MLILRVDDVGRRPQDPPDRGTDGDLSYFADWRERAGLRGLPAVYAVVPTWVNDSGHSWLMQELDPSKGEEIALHGWNHVKGEVVRIEDMMLGASRFQTDAYVPPYNEYDAMTLSSWNRAGGRWLLGGFDNEHHFRGDLPTRVGKLIHVPADPKLYGHAGEVLRQLENDLDHPQDPHDLRVVTLHVPWDNPDEVAELISVIRKSLVPLVEAEKHIVTHRHQRGRVIRGS